MASLGADLTLPVWKALTHCTMAIAPWPGWWLMGATAWGLTEPHQGSAGGNCMSLQHGGKD